MERKSVRIQGVLNAGVFIVLIGAVIYFLPRVIVGLSDQIIKWTGGSEVYLALLTGVGFGILLGIIFCETIRHYRDK